MKKKIYLTFMILSIIGFITSLYLTIEHFLETKGACDINATISCSLVNASLYSEILGVPVAVFGMLWFMGLLVLVWQAYKKKNTRYDRRVIYWSILGFLFVIYLITAEILLNKICPLCTLVHVIVLSTLGLAIYSKLS